MADNIYIDQGTGVPVSTDEISGIHYQRIKITDGTAESTTPVMTGEGTKTNALRVVLPTDASDVKVTLDGETVTVSDGGGSLTVDGTVAVSGAVPVTDNAGSLTVDDGGLSLTVDGTVAVSSIGGTVNVREVDIWGVRTRVSKRVAVSASQTGATVWQPTTGKRFVLTKLIYSASAAGTIQLFDGTDSGNTVVTPIMSIAANGGFVLDWPVWAPYRSAAVNNILKYTSGSGAAGSLYVEGWEE